MTRASRTRAPTGGASVHALPEPRRAVAIGMVAATTIVLQIGLTRILSVVIWYHWAFLAVSLALLGIAAPGVWFSLVTRRDPWLPRLLLLAGVTVPAGVFVTVHAPAWVGVQAAPWLCLAAALVAFLALGGTACLLLLSAPGATVARLYAADLVGASVGAAVTVPLLWLGPTPLVVAALGLLPLAAHTTLWPRRWLAPALIAVPSLLALTIGTPFEVHHTKTYSEIEPGRVPQYERWSPTVRVTVFDDVFWTSAPGGFLWGSGRARRAGTGPQQYWLEQDGSAGTPITRWSGDPTELGYLFDDVTSIGHELRPGRRVAIIGAGGGRDVLAALAANARQIDAIELHGVILETVRDRYGAFSGHLYDDPRVTPIVGEGRHVLSQSSTHYDLIQISLIDSWSATTAGAYTLAENHLYTVEAYQLFWSRLTDRGLLSTSRWLRGDFGLEVPRLLLLVRAALAREGVANPADHVAVVQGGAVGTVLVSRLPFAPEEYAKLNRIAANRGFVVHFPPEAATSGDRQLAQLFARGPEALAGQGIDLTPPTDDRPFFFQVLLPFDEVTRPTAVSLGVNNEGVWTLRLVITIVVAAALGMLLLPFLFTDRFERRGLWRGSGFFACIGFGFLLVEVTWIQKLVLLLGHPSRAATVVLGALLLGTGLGSLGAPHFGVERLQRWGWATGVLILGLTLGARLAPALLAWPGGALAAAAVLVLLVGGMTMGPWFALGLARFGDVNKPWFWAINGAASVVAGAGSLAVAMQLGYTVVGLLGAAAYGIAWWLLQGAAHAEPVEDAASVPETRPQAPSS